MKNNARLKQIAAQKLSNGTRVEKKHYPKINQAIYNSILPAVEYIKKIPTPYAVDFAVSLIEGAFINNAIRTLWAEMIPMQANHTRGYLVTTKSQDPYNLFGGYGEFSTEASIWATLVGDWERMYGAAVLKSIFINNVNDARDVITRAIEQAIADELDLQDTARMIEQVIKAEWRIKSKFNAARIARTETFKALNYGAEQGALSTGLDLVKIWMTNRDGREREAHASANGQIVDFKEKFRVGDDLLKYPCDPSGQAGNVINCRCQSAEMVKSLQF